MAKKEAKEAPEVDEDEIQEPVKPKKKSELGLVTIIGIIGGTVVFLVVLLYAVFWFGIRPYLAPQAPANPQEQVKDAHGAPADAHAKAEGEEEEEAAGGHGSFNSHDPLAKFLVTGRITTNPKNSSQFVILDLGIYSYYKDEDAKKTAEGGGGHGGSKDPTVMTPELGSRVKGVINRILGSMSAEELQARRDSLPVYFKKELKPVFKDNSLKLQEVVIQEFMLQ